MILFILIFFSLSFHFKHVNAFNLSCCDDRFILFTKNLKSIIFEKSSLYESNSNLAYDLNYLIKKMFIFGHTDHEILNFLFINYNDIIYFMPIFNNIYFILWFFPIFFIIFCVLLYIYFFIRN